MPENQDLNALRSLLATGEADQQAAAAEQLCHRSVEAWAAIAELLRGLASADSRVREWCNAALEEIGPPPRERIDLLIDTLQGPDASLYWAATLLGRAGAAASPSILSLRKLADTHSDAAVRRRANWAIKRISREG